MDDKGNKVADWYMSAIRETMGDLKVLLGADDYEVMLAVIEKIDNEFGSLVFDNDLSAEQIESMHEAIHVLYAMLTLDSPVAAIMEQSKQAVSGTVSKVAYLFPDPALNIEVGDMLTLRGLINGLYQVDSIDKEGYFLTKASGTAIGKKIVFSAIDVEQSLLSIKKEEKIPPLKADIPTKYDDVVTHIIYNHKDPDYIIRRVPQELLAIRDKWKELATPEGDIGDCIIGSGILFEYQDRWFFMPPAGPYQGSLSWIRHVDEIMVRLDAIGCRHIVYDHGVID